MHQFRGSRALRVRNLVPHEDLNFSSSPLAALIHFLLIIHHFLSSSGLLNPKTLAKLSKLLTPEEKIAHNSKRQPVKK